MKLQVLLAAALLLGGCGAEPTTPSSPPPSIPPPSSSALQFWGGPGQLSRRFWGVLQGAAHNVSTRVPLMQRLQSLAAEVGAQARLLGSRVQQDLEELGGRAADYGAEARAALELTWGELKGRGASYVRRVRKRLLRDQEELRKRWGHWGQLWDQGVATVRRSWQGPHVGPPVAPQVGPEELEL